MSYKLAKFHKLTIELDHYRTGLEKLPDLDKYPDGVTDQRHFYRKKVAKLEDELTKLHKELFGDFMESEG